MTQIERNGHNGISEVLSNGEGYPEKPRYYLDPTFREGKRSREGLLLPITEPHRFYGKVVHLSAKRTGDEMYGNSPYTVRQVEQLIELARERSERERRIAQAQQSEALILQGFAP